MSWILYKLKKKNESYSSQFVNLKDSRIMVRVFSCYNLITCNYRIKSSLLYLISSILCCSVGGRFNISITDKQFGVELYR